MNICGDERDCAADSPAQADVHGLDKKSRKDGTRRYKCKAPADARSCSRGTPCYGEAYNLICGLLQKVLRLDHARPQASLCRSRYSAC